MKNFRILPLLTILFVSFVSNAQIDGSINIMFYNVENLFDTIDNAATFDEDFTPNGKLEYNSIRYHEKLNHLAMVIDSSFNGEQPSVIGLCEVENSDVVAALRDETALIKLHDIVHIESPDGRGIDNALVFDSSMFHLDNFGLKRIDLGADERPTRGILWVVLTDKRSMNPIIFMVNHWPSRYGGAEESEWKRMRASETSVLLIDSLSKAYPSCGIVFMGDLNDHPDNKSLEMLESCDDDGPCLVNMHKKFVGSSEGSHVYKGEWGVLDQILVNQNLVQSKSAWAVDSSSAGFVKKTWMLYFSEQDNDFFPSRSYSGTRYFGGYSDHLPATLRLYMP